MKEKMLNINEVDATSNPVLYKCHGLGSCVALFLTDRQKHLSGGAHISLSSSQVNQYKDVIQLMNELLSAFRHQGSDLKYLRAKLAGGAKIFESTFTIGEENINAVLACLLENRIFVAASDVGGHVARAVQFNSMTGELKISTSDQKVYSI